MDVQEAWRRYSPLVREKCRRVLKDRDEADDVAQDVFLKLWQRRMPGDVRDVTAWLYKTATHLCIDRLRQRAMHQRPVPQPTLAADLEAATSHRQTLEKLVSLADAEELHVAVLSRLDGLTQPEAASVLGISERTVRRLLTRFDERVARLEVKS